MIKGSLLKGAFFSFGESRLMTIEYQKSIKFWSENDRPREKMLNQGAANLSDAELVTILLGSGTISESALDLSRRILAQADYNLLTVSRWSLRDFQNFKGVGLAKAVRLKAAFELGRRKELAGALKRKILSSSADAAAVLRPQIADLNHEEFWTLFLNNRNQLIGQRRISKGGLSGTVADPREVFRIALELKSTAIIVAHNHPSGSLKPSQADDALTRQMNASGEALLIKVLDHLIITSESYYSYSDEGRM